MNLEYLRLFIESEKAMLAKAAVEVLKYAEYDKYYLKKRKKKNSEETYVATYSENRWKLRYANRSMTGMVEAIINNRFFRLLEERLQANVALLESAVKRYNNYGINEVLEQLPKAYRIMTKEIRNFYRQNDAAEWKERLLRLKEEYPPGNPEKLTQPTCHPDVFVRSKSEALIYNLLVFLNIPFIYEAPFFCEGGIVVHPDFTLFKPWGTGDLLIEHDGMFMKKAMRYRTFNKMEQYYDSGLLFYEHILFTFDKADGTLNIDCVKQLILVCMSVVTPPLRPSVHRK